MTPPLLATATPPPALPKLPLADLLGELDAARADR